VKAIGWFLSAIGLIGLIGTLVAKASSRYELSHLGGMFGLGDGYASTVDALLIGSVIVLVVGVVLLVAGYVKGSSQAAQQVFLVQPPPTGHPPYPMPSPPQDPPSSGAA